MDLNGPKWDQCALLRAIVCTYTWWSSKLLFFSKELFEAKLLLEMHVLHNSLLYNPITSTRPSIISRSAPFLLKLDTTLLLFLLILVQIPASIREIPLLIGHFPLHKDLFPLHIHNSCCCIDISSLHIQ